MFRSTKTYNAETGLSCAFRQWRANHSHCQLLHGYALGFKFVFAADSLDERGWIMDFGALKELKAALVQTFDHTTVIAGDDPELHRFKQLDDAGIIDLRIMSDGVGVERFAFRAWLMANRVLAKTASEEMFKRNLRCLEVECLEHAGNSAIYISE